MFIKMCDANHQVIFEGFCSVVADQPLTLSYSDLERKVNLCFKLDGAIISHESEGVVSKTVINVYGASSIILITAFGEKSFGVDNVDYTYSDNLVILGYRLYDEGSLVGSYKFYFEMRD